MGLMNRRKILEIIINLIKYPTEFTTEEDILNLKHITEDEEYENNFTFDKENEFLCYLFKKYPYYQILNNLDKIENRIKTISNNKEILSFYYLIHGYILDLKPTISKRVFEEVYTHINLLAKIYYHNGYIESEEGSKIITKNMITAEELFERDIVTSRKYHQQSLFDASFKVDDIQDKASKNMYIKSNKITKNTITIIGKYFNEKTFNNFQSELLNIINEGEFNNEEKDLLKIVYSSAIDLIYKKIKQYWLEIANEEIPILLAYKKLD